MHSTLSPCSLPSLPHSHSPPKFVPLFSLTQANFPFSAINKKKLSLLRNQLLTAGGGILKGNFDSNFRRRHLESRRLLEEKIRKAKVDLLYENVKEKYNGVREYEGVIRGKKELKLPLVIAKEIKEQILENLRIYNRQQMNKNMSKSCDRVIFDLRKKDLEKIENFYRKKKEREYKKTYTIKYIDLEQNKYAYHKYIKNDKDNGLSRYVIDITG